MRDFSGVKRIVIKIGTNTLSPADGVDTAYLESVALQIKELQDRGYQVMIVSSGAIGIGAKRLGLGGKSRSVELRQACAAIGQPILMSHWDKPFTAIGIITAQVLVTRDDFNHRETYLNLKNAVETLLEYKTVPIFNENDSVSTREIGSVFGDNDSLSAHIASKLDAELLLLLSDIDALYEEDPRSNPDARKIGLVEELTDEIRNSAGDAGSEFATGGMTTKLKAVDIASKAGCRVVLAHGREQNVITRILDGESLGTLFLAGEKWSSRRRWIYNAEPKGRILVDTGAERALSRNKSLLPSGVTGIEGVFQNGDVVFINDAFKAVSSLNSNELQQVKGLHSEKIREILGSGHRDDIARPEDIVPWD